MVDETLPFKIASGQVQVAYQITPAKLKGLKGKDYYGFKFRLLFKNVLVAPVNVQQMRVVAEMRLAALFALKNIMEIIEEQKQQNTEKNEERKKAIERLLELLSRLDGAVFKILHQKDILETIKKAMKEEFGIDIQGIVFSMITDLEYREEGLEIKGFAVVSV